MNRMWFPMIDLLKKSSFFLLIGVFIIFIFIFTQDPEKQKTSDSTTVLSSNAIQESNSPDLDLKNDQTTMDNLFVDVKGAVVKPGVYEMKASDRVKDVIRRAGGFTEDADQTSVNLAQKVHDEMIIMVPYTLGIEEEANNHPSIPNSNSGAEKVRVNYASQEEIETLPGIGPSKAQAIIQYREEHGYFQTVEDLLQISGIGEKTLENMKDEIQIP